MPFGLGPFELVVILVIVMLVFGVGKLPEVGGAVGKAVRDFKKEVGEVEAAVKSSPSSDKAEDKPAEAPKA